MVYMAYKDLYQVSNTEVITHHCVIWGSLDGFPMVAGDLGSLHMSYCGQCGRLLGKRAS